MDTRKSEPISKDEKPKAVPEQAAQPGSDDTKAIFVGFRGEGADAKFVIEIPAVIGYHAIQGHILEASQELRMIVVRHQRAEAEKKIIRPSGGGRFNIFK